MLQPSWRPWPAPARPSGGSSTQGSCFAGRPGGLRFNARFRTPSVAAPHDVGRGPPAPARRRGPGSWRTGRSAGRDGACCCVVQVSDGYPGAYPGGAPSAAAGRDPGRGRVRRARRAGDQLVTSGGRVLGVTAWGADREAARARAMAWSPRWASRAPPGAPTSARPSRERRPRLGPEHPAPGLTSGSPAAGSATLRRLLPRGVGPRAASPSGRSTSGQALASSRCCCRGRGSPTWKPWTSSRVGGHGAALHTGQRRVGRGARRGHPHPERALSPLVVCNPPTGRRGGRSLLTPSGPPPATSSTAPSPDSPAWPVSGSASPSSCPSGARARRSRRSPGRAAAPPAVPDRRLVLLEGVQNRAPWRRSPVPWKTTSARCPRSGGGTRGWACPCGQIRPDRARLQRADHPSGT